jgi:hypothetical protein
METNPEVRKYNFPLKYFRLAHTQANLVLADMLFSLATDIINIKPDGKTRVDLSMMGGQGEQPWR